MKNEVKPKSASNSNVVNDNEKVDKIRDILFGNNINEFEKRFSDIERKNLQTISDIRSETKKMFDSLEIYIKNEIKDLYSKLDIVSEEREEKEKKISNEVDSLSAKLSKNKEEVHTTTREIRQQLLEQFKGLSEDIQKQSTDIKNILNDEVENLRDKKTDRMNLAALLTDMALQLRGEVTKETNGGE